MTKCCGTCANKKIWKKRGWYQCTKKPDCSGILNFLSDKILGSTCEFYCSEKEEVHFT